MAGKSPEDEELDRRIRKAAEALPVARQVHDEKTRTDGVFQPPRDRTPKPPYERKDSPPPVSNPAPRSESTTPTERELVQLRAEVADLLKERRSARGELPAYLELPWWRTTGGMVKVLGALFTGLGTLAAGGWFATRPPEAPPPPPPPPPADIVCPKFEDQGAARSSLCMRIHQLEGALGKAQRDADSALLREARKRRMLDEVEPTVTPKAKP